jgi:hypothetical protein
MIPNYTKAINTLTRHHRLKHHFLNSENNDIQQPPPKPPPPFKRKSIWQPPLAHPDTEQYLQTLPQNLDQIIKHKFQCNLTKQEWNTLKELAHNTDIIIKSADKGSGIVIEDTQQYITNGRKHLANTDIYTEVDKDPTHQIVEAINTYAKYLHGKGLIDSHIKDYLHAQAPDIRTQQLYFLKKIHKSPPQIRPIVSGTQGPTEHISALLDYYMQPLMHSIDSYIKDSTDLIRTLEQLKLPNNCFLCTIDVTALYTNIPQDEGITACMNMMYPDDDFNDDIPFPKQVAYKLMHTILDKNFFEFAGKIYKQIHGTAMGTKMAPAFANMFMHKLETTFLNKQTIKPTLWIRYIDDIFCIWTDTLDTLKQFLTNLNEEHSTIKFTHEISTSTIDILDLTVHKGPRFNKHNILDIKPHHKTTNKFQYLHHASSHPKSTHRGLITGEATRLLRASTNESTYNHQTQDLTQHLLARNYPHKFITNALTKVPYSRRQEVLTPKPATLIYTDQPPPFIIPYSPIIPHTNLKQALDPPSPNTPLPRITYTKNKSIANYVVRARLKNTPTPPRSDTKIIISHRPIFRSSSTPCSTPMCHCCAHMSKRQLIHDTAHKAYKLPAPTNCNSTTLIYALECTACTSKNIYIGQTRRTIKERINGHRASHTLPSLKNRPLYKHLTQSSHTFKDIRASILEMTTVDKLLERELHWINTLNTRHPHGFNSTYD